MESYGKTIATLRKKCGMTQSELGKELNVTYQAVSKWENGLSQPDLETIVAMCKLFGITVDEFTRIASGEENADSVLGESAAAAVPEAATVPAEPAMPAVTEQPQSQTYSQHTPSVSAGGHSFSIGYFLGLVAALVLAVTSFIVNAVTQKDVEWYINLFAAYMIFSYIALIGHECIIWDIFLGGFGKVVSMPGVIFSLDMNGILFLIVYKLIIAPIITVIIAIAFTIGAALLSFIMAPFVFPFKIPRIIKDTF